MNPIKTNPSAVCWLGTQIDAGLRGPTPPAVRAEGLREARRVCESKQRYECKKSALTAINQAMRRRRNRPDALKAYPCALCRGWHLAKLRR